MMFEVTMDVTQLIEAEDEAQAEFIAKEENKDLFNFVDVIDVNKVIAQ